MLAVPAAQPVKLLPAENPQQMSSAVKEEPLANTSDGSEAIDTSSTNDNNEFNNAIESDNGGKIPFKKIFQKRKKSSGK